MKQNRRFGKFAAYALAIALAGSAPLLLADQSTATDQSKTTEQPNGWGYGMGPDMMGGYGGGYGMGPGMMGGYGGGYGMGPGMMGAYLSSGLNLTDAQQAKINKIMDETRKQHWALMGAMMDQQARLRDLSAAPKQDDAAIGAAYKSLSQMQRQMYETMVDAQKRMEAVLTKEQQEQQEQLRKYWRNGGAPDR